jgi:hypothetical protein
MAENIERSGGRAENFKFDRGGQIADVGPFVGVVKNNVDSIRSGRLWVYIEQFGGENPEDNTNGWRLVNYLPPFYGVTEKNSSSAGTGNYPGNQQSYGMWFTPPDIGTRVLCLFVNGDPNLGYYIGCIPDPGVNRMIPAIGAVPKSQYVPGNKAQEAYFANSPQLPVTEINNENPQIDNNSKFYDQPKPVHSVQAAIYFQQGLDNDPERGPIGSSAQRESPSTVYGISTPGIPIYAGGQDPNTIRKQLNTGSVNPQDVQVIGRYGGHTLVMDDGDLDSNNALFRLRSAKGHQIMMNDSNDFIYIAHANGQTWIELGVEGTVDVYSTNSVNVRTEGTINLHADKDINMYAGGNISMKSGAATNIGAVTTMNLAAEAGLTLYSTAALGVRSDGSLSLQGASSSWNGGTKLALKAGRIDLNGGSAKTVTPPKLYPKRTLDDTVFNNSTGWQVKTGALESIVTRAPTHEPYKYHNQGVLATVNFVDGQPTPPPTAEPVPSGWNFQVKS